MRFPEHALAHQWLDGLHGLEIGAAAHNPFGLRTRNVAPPDDYEHYARAQEDCDVAPAPVDLWGTAEALPVPDDSEDFILSSHVVEHLPNVVQAFGEWNRVVRTGGYVFMVVPRRDALPADVGRPVTPLAHFLDDYRRGHTLDTHPVDGVPGGRMGHYHVFTPDSLLAVVAWMNEQGLCDWRLVAREDVDSKVGNGFTLVFRVAAKPAPAAAPGPPAVTARPPAPADETPAELPRVISLEDRRRQALVLHRKNQELAANTRALAEQGQTIADLRRALNEKGRLLADQRRALDEQAQALAGQQENLVELERRLTTAERRVRAEAASLGGKALEMFRLLRNYLLPPDTRRWRVYAGLRRPLLWLFADARRLALKRLLERGGAAALDRSRAAGLSLRQLRADLQRFRYRPLVSVLTPVYNVDARWLDKAIDSVRRQVYPHWELCLVNDASPAAHVRPLLDAAAAADPRIRVKHLAVNEGIAGASNHALGMARGEFVGLLDHDDELTRDALLEVVRRLNDDPHADLLYSDEDKIGPDSAPMDPLFKPDWNPTLLLSCNYITHFSVFRRDLLHEVGGFRPGFDGSQDYELLLRFTERTGRVVHIPRVLYHWRAIEGSAAASESAKPQAYPAARRALDQAVRRRGLDGRAESVAPGLYKVHYRLPRQALVSLVVFPPHPAADPRPDLDRLERATAYSPCEVLAPESEPADGRPLAAALNRAARAARGEYLIFLAAGLEPLRPDWIEALLEQGHRPGVGAVGARILRPDGRLTHSGIVLGPRGRVKSSHRHLPVDSLNRLIYTEVVRDCSAVSGDCLLIARQLFEEMGGFNEQFRQTYHDIDLCLRLRRRQFAVVYTPWAVFKQPGGPAGDRLPFLGDEKVFRQLWETNLGPGDPLFNPNLLPPARKAG